MLFSFVHWRSQISIAQYTDSAVGSEGSGFNSIKSYFFLMSSRRALIST